MSGIEVADLVLGAFPIAIELLDKYREVATRAGLFYQIKLKHRQCRNRLECERLVFTGNLKQLLLPLVVDDEKITDMISDPGGPSWMDSSTSDLLIKRLTHSYDVYMDCIEHLDDVMKKLIHELALDSDTVQKSLGDPKLPITKERLRNTLTKTGIEYQAYKIKFSNGESTRNSLFKELDSLNKRLEQLLSISDKEAQLIQDRQASAVTSAIDSAICNLWINASKLFEALTTAWRCTCQGQHSARLLLQHRNTKKSEFNVFFARPEDSQWRIQETRISEDNELEKKESNGFICSTVGSHEPTRLVKRPRKSAMKSTGKTIDRPVPSVTLMTIPAMHVSPAVKPIANLCASLNDNNASCVGFLPHDDCQFYVYRVPRQNNKTLNSVTLEQIFRGHASKPLDRRQRLALSFVISSSFLQLLSTPWLTASWAKSDIMFVSDANDPEMFALDRPHLYRNLAERDCQKQSDENITRSLRQLGIVLLELCFGKLLEDQPCRKRWPLVDDENAKFALDVAAALDWLQEVEGEAGLDYASAVGWCLLATRPGRWRQEMLRKVVQPLEGCYQCLASQGRL
ncbi:hypothetical protein F4677DRAFT_367696 [Hypoxylon crocopeplum]|nr:hypothetical protein F4677DRAFT_367696 [Hypoxylon crocopeplum]